MSDEINIHGVSFDLDEYESAPSRMSAIDEAIERIEAMDEALDQVKAANDELASALHRYAEAQAYAARLSSYLGSEQWMEDFEADERGLLPRDLKRGVLSEDGAFNALADNYDTAIALLETATKALKNN